MSESMTLSASLEDYLEAIFHIVAEKQVARVKDISKRLSVNNSSVTGALHSLAEKGLVNYAPYEIITLTRQGKTMARDVVRRHEALRDFFVKVLLVKENEAEEAACEMEHAIPRTILQKLTEYIEFIEVCPRAGTGWIKGFSYYCDHAETQENCERCIALCLEEVKEKRKKGVNVKKTMALNELKPGQKARIKKIRRKGETSKRIVDMGVTPGTPVEVERVAPLGDPIEIKIKGYHLSLRKEEAADITVEMQ
jgi:DtxR family Mn-dependent transcriptional regulator